MISSFQMAFGITPNVARPTLAVRYARFIRLRWVKRGESSVDCSCGVRRSRVDPPGPPMEAAEMTRLNTLPSTREQARHALLLLGAPAPARLVVGVHQALFDGDLEASSLTALLRAERHAAAPVVCHGLAGDLTAAHVALAAWPLPRRIVLPAAARADALRSLIRVADLVALHTGAGRSADLLLRE